MTDEPHDDHARPGSQHGTASSAPGVDNDLSGAVHNAVQAGHVGGNVNINNTYIGSTESAEPVQPQQVSPASVSLGKRLGWLAGIGIVLYFILHSCFSHDTANQISSTQFPSEHGKRPAGSTDQAVLAAVSDTIHSCAQAAVLQPANCPQSVASADPQVTNVHWFLYGDPTDGAQVTWHDTQFYVRGMAIMTVTYTSGNTAASLGTPVSPLQVVPFQATVTWQSNRASVDSIQKTAPIPSGVVRKHDPAVDPGQAAAVLRAAFAHCQASTTEPMPPECPQPSTPSNDTSVTWSFQGDPVLNISKPAFDVSTGLIHIYGSYAVTGHTTDFGFAVQYQQSGNYDAILVEDDGTLRCLQIQSK